MKRTAEQLKVDFVQAAISYGEDLGSGRKSTKISDRAYKQAVKIYERLCEQDEQHQILELLEFAHPAVRLFAAGIAIRFDLDQTRGTRVLESLAASDGPIAAMATVSLAGLRHRQRQAA